MSDLAEQITQLWTGRDDLAAVMSPSEARTVVHEAIERSLLALRDGHGLSEASLIEDTVRQMREEWKGSRAGMPRSLSL